MNQPRLWTRDFIIVSALNFLLVMVFYLLMVVIGIYATREFHATASQAGLVSGVFIVGVLAGRFLSTLLMGRVGRKRSLLIGLLLTVAACLCYFIEAGIVFLIANRFLHGASVGVAATVIATVVAHLIPVSRSGEGIGYYSMSSSLATAIGPFIGILMLQYTDFRMVLALCSFLSVVCFLVGWVLYVPELERSSNKKSTRLFSFSGLIEPRVIPIAIIVFLLGTYYSSVLSFLNIYALESGLAKAASFFFIVFAVTLMASRPFTGRLLDSHGANIIMYPGFVIMALGLVTLGMADSGTHMLISAFLLGLGFGNMQSSSQAIAIKSVEPEQYGAATSTFYIFVDAGLGFGPYLLGLIVPFTGYGNLYSLLGCMTLASIGVYYVVCGRRNIGAS